eukprot:IDg21290t1
MVADTLARNDEMLRADSQPSVRRLAIDAPRVCVQPGTCSCHRSDRTATLHRAKRHPSTHTHIPMHTDSNDADDDGDDDGGDDCRPAR